MNRSGVQRDDMDPLLTEDALSNVLSGRIDPALADDQLVAFLAEGADSLRSLEPAQPSPALREFLGVTSLHTHPPTGGAVVTGDIDLRRSALTQRKSKMLTSTAAFAATFVGKLVFSAVAAAAAMGGAHATGIVDFTQADGDSAAVAFTDSTSASLDAGAAATSEDGTVAAQGSADVSVEQQTTVRIPIDQLGAFVMSLEGDALVLETVEVLMGTTAAVQADGSVLFTTGARQVVVGATFDGAAIRLAVVRDGSTTTNLFDAVGRLLPNDGRVGVGVNATIGATMTIKPSTIVDMGVNSAAGAGEAVTAAVDAAADAVGSVTSTAGAAADAAATVTTTADAAADAAATVTTTVGAATDAAATVTTTADPAADAAATVTGTVGTANDAASSAASTAGAATDAAATVTTTADAAADAAVTVTGTVGTATDVAGSVTSTADAAANPLVADVQDSAGLATDVVEQGLGLSLSADAEASGDAQGGLDLGGAVGGLGSLFGS